MTIPPPMLLRLQGGDATTANALRAVQDFAERAGLPGAMRSDLLVVTDEIVSNLLKYGGVPRERVELEIRASIEQGALTLQFADNGRPFDPLSAPPPALEIPVEQRPIGGLGIHLVRELTDEQRYARAEGRNVLVLTRAVGR